MLEGALIMLAGMVVGRLLSGRRRPSSSEPESICGCKHHLALHDPTDGRCHGLMRNPAYEPTYVTDERNPEKVQCTCRQYVGPTSAASIVAAFQPRSLES